MKRAPISISPRMVEDIKRVPALAMLLECGDIAVRRRPPLCRDHDEDCAEVPDKVHCYLYDPAKGRCPFLSTEDPQP